MKSEDTLTPNQDDESITGKRTSIKNVAQNRAPEKANHESDMTPPENEVYVDLEPDELSQEDEPLDVEEQNKHKK